jgi:hypothetical protein
MPDIEITPDTDPNELADELADGLESGELTADEVVDDIVEAMVDGVPGPDGEHAERLSRDLDAATGDDLV